MRAKVTGLFPDMAEEIRKMDRADLIEILELSSNAKPAESEQKPQP